MDNDQMWLIHNCAFLPNKVGSCPNTKEFNSTESDKVKHTALIDYGLNKLEKMESIVHLLLCATENLPLIELHLLQPVKCDEGILKKFRMQTSWRSNTHARHYFA